MNPDRGEMQEAMERFTKEFVAIMPPLLLVLIRRFQVPKEVAEDAVQSAYVKLAGKIQTEGRGSLPGSPEELGRYVYVVASRHCMDHFRLVSMERRREHALIQAISQVERIDAESVTDDEIRRLRSAVAGLGEPYGPIFMMLIEEGASLADIARKLGIKSGSIYSQYQRGIELLRKALGVERRGI